MKIRKILKKNERVDVDSLMYNENVKNATIEFSRTQKDSKYVL